MRLHVGNGLTLLVKKTNRGLYIFAGFILPLSVQGSMFHFIYLINVFPDELCFSQAITQDHVHLILIDAGFNRLDHAP